ncbi:hypothetical protein BY458DRAFT_518502 [Sporodiniella umbellata]|nr:hypothetical protein BY458DRAFT_518502 [Sporodiniella umbellata]
MLTKASAFPWLVMALVLYFVFPPIIKTLLWGEDELKLVDLAKEMDQADQTFYSRLGVEVSASIKEINKAYRQLVVKQQYVYRFKGLYLFFFVL